MEEKIKSKNFYINLMINEVLIKMKKNGIKTIGYENGKPYIQEPSKTILEMEVEKTLSIYKAEFIQFVDTKKEKHIDNIAISLYESEEMDAHGHYGGIEFSSGTQQFLEGLSKEKYLQMGYNIDENGNKVNNNSLIENDLDIDDYLAFASIKEIGDINFFLDAIPHEAMHVFGFKGGIFEGATENFARQVAAKYNLRIAPFAHKNETKFFQKLEKVLGRSAISERTYVKDEEDRERYIELSDSIDQNLNLTEDDNGLFKNICELEKEFFSIYKADSKDERLEKIWQERRKSIIDLNQKLDNYITTYPDKLYQLGEDDEKLTEDQQIARHLEYKKILSMQDKEIEMLGLIIANLEKEEMSNSNGKSKNDFMNSLKLQISSNNSNDGLISTERTVSIKKDIDSIGDNDKYI